MKYGIWNVSTYDRGAAENLTRAGFSSLTAAVLCSRGCTEPESARAFLNAAGPLHDPMELKEMDIAAQRVLRGLNSGEHMAVYGDYDVDGITATCLLTEFLRSQGGNVDYYIPGRIEEGYGLNVPAIDRLKAQGVTLIITVDCGITANAEADYCRRIGMDLIITDHHECKDELPHAVAVVDPHRKDRTYPHTNLAGVGVAFKLACAILGDQQVILNRFSDLLCLGTVADVMPLLGENRAFVAHGLKALSRNARPGVTALLAECGGDSRTITANTVGYTLAPRINAAGRMGQVELATELFLTTDTARAEYLARELCALNRQRQDVEAEIYRQAVKMLPREKPNAIVLAGEDWHQGVVGIVASRLAEEYACPTFLICLDGDKGKASSRSYGGFNLFAALVAHSDLLESFGGHELAAGFTIHRDHIDAFREGVLAMAGEFVASGQRKAALEIDCAVQPRMLTEKGVASLDQLEPCGAGCPKPVFFMDDMLVDQLAEVGGGKHLRLRLSRDGSSFPAIFFSTTAAKAGVEAGDRIQIAFTPQINEYRGMRSVQLNMVDLRQADLNGPDGLYRKFSAGQALTAEEAALLLPDRTDFSDLWRYLAANATADQYADTLDNLCRTLTEGLCREFSLNRLRLCLDVFRERGLMTCSVAHGTVYVAFSRNQSKVDLNGSPLLISLTKYKDGK